MFLYNVILKCFQNHCHLFKSQKQTKAFFKVSRSLFLVLNWTTNSWRGIKNLLRSRHEKARESCHHGPENGKQKFNQARRRSDNGGSAKGRWSHIQKKNYFYITSDSFVLFGWNILYNPWINCLKSRVRLWLFEGKSGANEQVIKMRGDYVLICKGDKSLIPLHINT